MRPFHGLLAFSAVVLLVGAVGCEDPQYEAEQRQMAFSERMTYTKDERVGLCYGEFKCGPGYAKEDYPCSVFTEVPCEAVKSLLPKGKEVLTSEATAEKTADSAEAANLMVFFGLAVSFALGGCAAVLAVKLIEAAKRARAKLSQKGDGK